jgi:protein TonB
VTSVTPVGSADPTFLDAARRHILRHWRYQPATEGGEAVASTVVITLSFKLEE